ncbi:UNVERIFIED_CONTAM: protein NLP7 [Sesamum radiatum]|uniref:Protein NLP7 n=1 Tax=Sesamum radiatum TaxID=300843 RepID=A0AAW2TGI8_SESRA
MKETLRSLKLASGKQLGEDLVVEVISFDKNDKFSSFELYQPDVLPVRFEVTQFVEQEPRYNQNKRRNPSLFETSTSEKRVRCSEQHNQNALQTCGIESNQNHTKLAEDGVVLIKAKFGDDIAKLQLLLSSGIEKLRQEVAKRFDLTRGRFKLYYLDEDEWILLACEDDLQLCMKTLTASRKTPIQMLVKSVCN